MSCRHAIYFSHFYPLHPDHPHMLLWTFAILCFFFFFYHGCGVISWNMANLPRSSSPSHGSPRFSVASQRWALGCPVSSPCCRVDWFHLVRVLCRAPQLLWAHGCPAFPSLWLLEPLCPIFQGISWSCPISGWALRRLPILWPVRFLSYPLSTKQKRFSNEDWELL